MSQDDRSFAEHLARRRNCFYPKADIEISDGVLRTLALRKDEAPRQDWAAIFSFYGLAGASLLPSPLQGTFHSVHRIASPKAGPPLALRINRVSDHFVDWGLLAEQAISRRLEAEGVAHARILAADCSRRLVPVDYQLLEFVEGVRLATLDDDDQAVAAPLTAAAAYLARLHQVEGTGFGHISEAAGRRLQGVHASWGDYLTTRLDVHAATARDAGLIDAAEQHAVAAWFRRAEPLLKAAPSRLLHGDCGNHNLFIRADGAVAMIDWEDALLGDPLFELAFWATFHPMRRWEPFFAAYFGRPWSPHGLFWLYFLRISLSKTALRLRFGYEDKPGRSKASLRIQQGLAGLESCRDM